jgi:hypothetical protein
LQPLLEHRLPLLLLLQALLLLPVLCCCRGSCQSLCEGCD